MASNYFYHYDGSGNVMQLTDSTQAVAARYDYDSWGVTQTNSGSYANQPYRWSTKEQDAVTGLYYYGFRFYSPSMRTWINRDPIREAGGLNLYAFVGNNPINMLDERGLISVYPGSLVDAGIDAGLDPCAPWYQKVWYYGKPIFKQIALDVLIFAATDGMKGPRPGGRPTMGPKFGLADPNSIKFGQEGVSWNFSSGGNIGDTANALRSGAPDLPPIRVIEQEGNLVTLDNRRLLTYRSAGRQIPYTMVDPKNPEIKRVIEKHIDVPGGIDSPFIRNVP